MGARGAGDPPGPVLLRHHGGHPEYRGSSARRRRALEDGRFPYPQAESRILFATFPAIFVAWAVLPPERVTIHAGAARWSRALALIVVATAVEVSAQPAAAPSAAEQELAAEAEKSAPVLISGEVVIWIPTGAGQYTPAVRAAGIAARLEDAIADRSVANPTVTAVDVEDSSEVRMGPRLLMIVTAQDARRLGASRTTISTTRSSHNRPPAASVSAMWSSKQSSGSMTPAMPP